MNNVFNIGNKSTCPPAGEFVLIDTSVILELIGHDEESLRTKEVNEFFMKLIDNENIIATSVKTWEELNIIVERDLPRNKKQLYRKINAFEEVNNKFSNIKSVFNSLPNVYSEPIGIVNNDIMKKAEEKRVKHKLRWGDSVIMAIAEQEEINHFWALDSDYCRVNNGMSIYLDSKSYNTALSYNIDDTTPKNAAK